MDLLHIWLPLPLLVWLHTHHAMRNIIAALEQRDRVRWVVGNLTWFTAWEFPTVMLEPFPALTHLILLSYHHSLALPDKFLGGSAPRLQFLKLSGIPLQTLPKLLTNNLVHLHLWEVPYHDCILPDAMVAGLSALTRLETLDIGFRSLVFLPPQSA
jgi:hypothetical protein